MSGIIDQLGINQTLYIQFGIFTVVFLVLTNTYFKPFLKLIQLRHRRTTEDRAAAEKLDSQADTMMGDYQKRLTEGRAVARSEFDAIVGEGKKAENQILSEARDQAKASTQEALSQIDEQRGNLKKALESEVETLAKTISERLLT